ncbi:MAG: GNAT family N-acetyltransferase [Variovorax sp.]|jgi:ribosomal protein S18 acetylase RimI-like enzyme|nr:MAG: GNAT family N-acetyltransferase [Variovorax sp.]
MTLRLLEAAAFAAWPAESAFDVRGWHLRLDHGYTKRANSANATDRSEPLSDLDIDAIEARFASRGLTPAFRLPDTIPASGAILAHDARLARRGYAACDRSLVMTRALAPGDIARDACASRDPDADPRLVPDPSAWLDAFGAVAGQGAADLAAHRDILRRVAQPCVGVVAGRAGQPLGCGWSVRVGPRVGLFDIATRVGHQRKGHARRCCQALMAWGARQGARTAFLQVLASNEPAIQLYRSLGFDIAYGYAYRVLPRPDARGTPG